MKQWIKNGTIGGNYLKKMLGSMEIDAHLLKIPKGGCIKWHVDENQQNKKIYRINFYLKKAKHGGRFLCPLQILDFWRINIYRPDIEPHCITTVDEGEVIIFSFGVTF